MHPSAQPTVQPSHQPTNQPSGQPIAQPSAQPSVTPTRQPSSQPSTKPSRQPSNEPSSQPSVYPSTQPSSQPSAEPSLTPSCIPTTQPSKQPSSKPSLRPSVTPSKTPSGQPTSEPTAQPTTEPSRQPSGRPSMVPSSVPTVQPTAQPSFAPSLVPDPPSSNPSGQPSTQPTAQPSSQPSSQPSRRPPPVPTPLPTRVPTSSPTFLANPDRVLSNVLDNALQRLPLNSSTPVSTTTYSDGVAQVAVSVVRPSNKTNNATAASLSIVLPESSTTISISTDGLSSTTVAVVVTTVELGSGTVGFNGNSSRNNSLPAPQLVSSVVTIQVKKVYSNGTLSSSTVPYFETSMTVSGPASRPTVLAHNCTLGVAETVSVYCTDTAVRLNLTCSGRAAATVRRQCPVSRAVCSVVDLTENRIVSNDFCRTVDLGSSVVCQCGGSSVNGSALASAGRVSVGLFRTYGTGSLTVAFGNTLSASAVAEKSVMMFVLFGSIWSMGLCLVALSWQQGALSNGLSLWVKGKVGASPSSTEVVAADVEEEKSRPSVQSSVKALLLAMLPPFFQHRQTANGPWWQRRWVRVLTARHPYARLLRHMVHGALTEDVTEGAAEAKEAILDVVYVLTALTMACFVLAVLFDFQYPEDDGSCALLTTEASCVSGKMLLDPLQSQCLWRPRSVSTNDVVLRQIMFGQVFDTTPIVTSDDTASSSAVECVFNGSNNSTMAFLLSFIITSFFATLLRHFLDWCFVVLTAHDQATDMTVAIEQTGEEEKSEEAQARQYSAAAVRRFCQRMQPSGMGRATRWYVDTNNVHEPHEAALSALEVLRRAPPQPSANSLKSSRRSDEADAAVVKLRLAMADVLGSTGDREQERHVYFLGLYRAFPEVVTLRHVQIRQSLVAFVLMAFNGGALYYIIGKAAVRGYNWQVSFLQIALFEWLSEVVLMQSLEVWLFDYGLCWLVRREVEAAVQRIVNAADQADTSQCWSFSSASSVSSASSLASQGVSRRRPELVRRSQLSQLLQQQMSSRATGLVDRSAYRRRMLRLLSCASLERWETVVSFTATLVLALLVYVFSLAVDGKRQTLAPVLMVGAIAVLVAIVVAVRYVYYRWTSPARLSAATVTPLPVCDTSDGKQRHNKPQVPSSADIGLLGSSYDNAHRDPPSRDGSQYHDIEDNAQAVLAENIKQRSSPVVLVDTADDNDGGLSMKLSVASADDSDDSDAEVTTEYTAVQGYNYNDEDEDCVSMVGHEDDIDDDDNVDDIDDDEASPCPLHMTARTISYANVERIASRGLSSFSFGDSFLGMEDGKSSSDDLEASEQSGRVVLPPSASKATPNRATARGLSSFLLGDSFVCVKDGDSSSSSSDDLDMSEHSVRVVPRTATKATPHRGIAGNLPSFSLGDSSLVGGAFAHSPRFVPRTITKATAKNKPTPNQTAALNKATTRGVSSFSLDDSFVGVQDGDSSSSSDDLDVSEHSVRVVPRTVTKATPLSPNVTPNISTTRGLSSFSLGDSFLGVEDDEASVVPLTVFKTAVNRSTSRGLSSFSLGDSFVGVDDDEDSFDDDERSGHPVRDVARPASEAAVNRSTSRGLSTLSFDDGEASADDSVRVAARNALQAAVSRIFARGPSSMSFGDSFMGINDGEEGSEHSVDPDARGVISEAAMNKITSTVLSFLYGSPGS